MWVSTSPNHRRILKSSHICCLRPPHQVYTTVAPLLYCSVLLGDELSCTLVRPQDPLLALAYFYVSSLQEFRCHIQAVLYSTHTSFPSRSGRTTPSVPLVYTAILGPKYSAQFLTWTYLTVLYIVSKYIIPSCDAESYVQFYSSCRNLKLPYCCGGRVEGCQSCRCRG